MFEGVITALITPFKDGQVDYNSLEKLVSWQLANGIEGFVVNGTTGESPTLLPDEVEKIFLFVKNRVPEKFPLLLGTGSNSTAKTIENTKKAAKLGAHGALIVVPYYNKPTQMGMAEHFGAVATEIPKLPIMLYNVPGRTVVSMQSDTVKKLSEFNNIKGIKEASGNMELGQDIIKKNQTSFIVSSGDDLTCLDLALIGGKGVISVISHVIPKELRQLMDRARKGEVDVKTSYKKYNELNKLIGIEPNPIPVKMALYKMGIISSPELRLPLTKMTNSNSELLTQELSRLGILK
jgi:4-hydroxy-tetrahydrodipicolinate synthase